MAKLKAGGIGFLVVDCPGASDFADEYQYFITEGTIRLQRHPERAA
jgi:hypothetical protein